MSVSHVSRRQSWLRRWYRTVRVAALWHVLAHGRHHSTFLSLRPPQGRSPPPPPWPLLWWYIGIKMKQFVCPIPHQYNYLL